MNVTMRGDRLRLLRERYGLSQNDLADRLGTSQTQIMRWEGNKVIPSAESVISLAKFFNVSSDYLLGLVATPTGSIVDSDLTNDEQALIHYLRTGQLTEAMNALAAVASKNS